MEADEEIISLDELDEGLAEVGPSVEEIADRDLFGEPETYSRMEEASRDGLAELTGTTMTDDDARTWMERMLGKYRPSYYLLARAIVRFSKRQATILHKAYLAKDMDMAMLIIASCNGDYPKIKRFLCLEENNFQEPVLQEASDAVKAVYELEAE